MTVMDEQRKADVEPTFAREEDSPRREAGVSLAKARRPLPLSAIDVPGSASDAHFLNVISPLLSRSTSTSTFNSAL